MVTLRTCCCAFSIKFGALFASVFVAITSSMFLVKDIAWIHVLTYGQSPDGLESFVDSMMAKSTNDTGVLVHLKPIYVSLSSFNVSERHLEYTRRYIASYALHAIWSGCGILASLALCASVLNNKSLFVLPWLTWSAVNVVIIAVNGVVDIVMWSHFRIYNSLNWFALFIYSSVPFMVYLILIVTRYYAIIEADISEDEIYRDNVKWCQCKCGTPRDSFQFDSEFVSPAHLLTRIQGQMVQNTVSDTLATKNHVILRQDENQSSVNRSVMTNCSPIEETVQRLKARSKMAVGKVIDTNQTVNPPNNLSPIPKRTMIRTISCRKRNPVAVVSMNETERKMFMHRLSKQALYASNNQKTKMVNSAHIRQIDSLLS